MPICHSITQFCQGPVVIVKIFSFPDVHPHRLVASRRAAAERVADWFIALPADLTSVAACWTSV